MLFTVGTGILTEYHEKALVICQQSSDVICCMYWTSHSRKVLEQSVLQLYIALESYGIHLMIAESS